MTRKIVALSFLMCMQWNSAVFAMDELQKKVKAQQQFVVGDLHDIEYVKNSINEMCQIDQEVRVYFMKNRSNLVAIEMMHEMDQIHTMRMKAIITQHGWMTISKFGAQVDSQAWLLVQHADHDPLFQEQCLLLLQNLLETKETNSRNYAYLYDRVALQSSVMGMKQKYGTQYFISDSGDVSLRPYDGTLQDLNERRDLMGLMPIEAYIEQIKSVYTK